jgi:hypothetical protein
MITGTLAWPLKEPGSTLDYALDLSSLPTDETVTAASGSVLPSGAGELAIQSITLIGTDLVVFLTPAACRGATTESRSTSRRWTPRTSPARTNF